MFNPLNPAAVKARLLFRGGVDCIVASETGAIGAPWITAIPAEDDRTALGGTRGARAITRGVERDRHPGAAFLGVNAQGAFEIAKRGCRSAWTTKVDGSTMCSASSSGGTPSTKTFTCMGTRMAASCDKVCATTSGSTMQSARTKYWQIEHRTMSTSVAPSSKPRHDRGGIESGRAADAARQTASVEDH